MLKTITEVHSGIVTSVAYHPKIDEMLSASIDGLVKVWKPWDKKIIIKTLLHFEVLLKPFLF